MSLIMNWSGHLFDPFNIQKEDMEGIGLQAAVTLSRIQRFWGQLKEPYTVAQHCLSMVEYLEGQGADQNSLKWALGHEIFEALGIGDIPSPLKRRMPDIMAAEERALELFGEVYGLTPPLPEDVKIADAGLLVMEAEALMPRTDYDWRKYGEPKGKLYKLGIGADEAKKDFLLKWQELLGRV